MEAGGYEIREGLPGVWHEEIWLSTLSIEAIATGTIPRGFNKRVVARVEEDMQTYSVEFDPRGRVVAIFGHLSGADGIKRLFEVPAPSRRPALTALAHVKGHRGPLKTALTVELGGHSWVGLADDVALCQRGCEACVRDNSHAVVYHSAQAIPIPMGTLDRVHMDLLDLGPSDVLNAEGQPFQYVLLFVDALSKFPVAYAIANKEMNTIATALWQFITLFGAPVVLVSDQGAEFVNEVIAGLAKLHGIDRRITSPYRPQANGQVERFNRALINILRKCTGDAPGRWYDWMEFALMVIRTSVHSATGLTPFEVLFGRVPRP